MDPTASILDIRSGIIYILAQTDLYHVDEVDTDENEVIAMYHQFFLRFILLLIM